MVSSYLHLIRTIALYDVESQEVLSYILDDDDDDNFSSPCSEDHFFNTKTQAEEYLEARRSELKAMMPKVRKFLIDIQDISSSEDFPFEKAEYLPNYLMPSTGFYEKENQRLNQIIDILEIAHQQHMLCINANTIPLEAIGRIAWYDDKAEIYYGSGYFGALNCVSTCNRAEFSAVRILFGRNASNKTINSK